MSLTARLRAGVIGLVLVVTLGTIAYVVVEGVPAGDALYMVLITITTVGYREVFALDGTGRLITAAVLVLGLGLVLYTAVAAVEEAFAYGATRRSERMLRRVGALRNHVILCGFGRVGRGTWENLQSRAVDVAVIEIDPTRAEEARKLGALVIEGDATHDQVLTAAGIDRAASLVACVTHDSDNLVIVLSARALRAGLRIVSRAGEAEWEQKLLRAGADRVVPVQVVGSERLAAMAIEPTLADVFDLFVGGRRVEFAVEEIRISPTSPAAGRSIRTARVREESGALILAVEDPARKTLRTAHPDQVLTADTVVIVVGTQSQVEAAAALLAPAPA